MKKKKNNEQLERNKYAIRYKKYPLEQTERDLQQQVKFGVIRRKKKLNALER